MPSQHFMNSRDPVQQSHTPPIYIGGGEGKNSIPNGHIIGGTTPRGSLLYIGGLVVMRPI